MEDAIDCVEKTWKWYGEGRVIMPNKITTDMSELGVAGWFNSMPAYIGPMDVAGIKVVGGYDGNKALGLPYVRYERDLTELTAQGLAAEKLHVVHSYDEAAEAAARARLPPPRSRRAAWGGRRRTRGLPRLVFCRCAW